MNALRKLLKGFGFCGMIALTMPGAFAQGYPVKPVKVIVPYPPGGGTDASTRIIAKKLSESLGQPVVIENKPGAGTLIGAEVAAKSAPDGYTLFLGSIATMSINTSLYNKLPYDPLKDFTPLSQTFSYPLVLVTNPSVAATSVKELLALAKAKPGQMNYASFGNGSSSHLGTELLKSMAGVDIVHITYKGSAPAIMDVMGGKVEMMFVDPPAAVAHIASGRIKGMAVSSAHRSPLLPEMPAVSDVVPGFGFTSWGGLLVPAGTPADIVDRLQLEIVRILKLPDVQQQFAHLGIEPTGSTSQQFAELIASETAKWAEVVKASGAKLD